VPIYASLNAGERVVTEGSFLLRAESLKLNPGQLTASAAQPATKQNSFKLRQGVPARITFVRKVESGCGTEVVLADYNIKRELPFNRAVTVEFTPTKAGEFKFACGMDMLRGKIIVQR